MAVAAVMARTTSITHARQMRSRAPLYGQLIFFALRDIQPGDEITIDYEQTLHPDSKRCYCGAATCRGRINKVART